LQDLLPELIGFLLGSIATYLIFDRLIESQRRRTWRTVEGQLLKDQAIYAARVLDALMVRYSTPASNALFISGESSRVEGEPAGAIDARDAVYMMRQALETGNFADLARLVLDSPRDEAKPDRHTFNCHIILLHCCGHTRQLLK
jgi:hypothetical protein